jgi:phage gpG-like protein
MAKTKLTKGQVRSLDGDNPKLTFKIEEAFGVDVSKNKKVLSKIGQKILDKIRERTEENLSRFGRPFRGYSDTYKESLDFKAAGKSEGDVNLKLTGDMMGLMTVIDEGKNSVTIGWNDSEDAAKAHGHIDGLFGKKSLRRDFFGLRNDEIREISREIKAELKDDGES